MKAIEAASIRRRTLAALAANRAPGFHFPGFFLELAWPRMGKRSLLETMPTGHHCLGTDGAVHPAALGVMIDGALATAPRLELATGVRLATVHLNVQYTGHPAQSELAIDADLEGFFADNAVRQALTRCVLTSRGQPVCHASGTFVTLPPPPGVKLAALPWQKKGEPAAPPLDPHELHPNERIVVRAMEKALEPDEGNRSFIERFWGLAPKRVAGGATCRVKIEPQIGNRVGHVQGGILLGLAQLTASAAAPHHPAVSTISAWYVSPGHGKALTARSKVIHAGRSFAVVRTEIKNADGSRVLEAVSNHASQRT